MEISYLSLAITIITSTCISGGIVGIIITFILERIASRIDGRFEQRLNKELENSKIRKEKIDKDIQIIYSENTKNDAKYEKDNTKAKPYIML